MNGLDSSKAKWRVRHSRQYWIAVASLSLTVSCGTDEGQTGTDSAVVGVVPTPARIFEPEGPYPPDTLRPARAFGAEETWGYLAKVRVLGDSLFVYDLYGTTIVSVLDRHTGELLGQFGRRGGGPGEYRTVTDVFAGTAPGEFWILDAGARRLSRYGPSSAGSTTPRLLATRSVDLDGRTEGARFTDRGLVAGGIFHGSPVLIADTTARYVSRRLGRYPLHAPGDSTRTDLNINRTSVAFHPDLTKVALAYFHNNVVQIVDLTREGTLTIAGPELFDPPRGPEIADPNPRRVAYWPIRATRRHVYAMFCGCLVPPGAEPPTSLHVFTWSGELVAILPIAPPSRTFDVSPDDRFLYTVTRDPYPQVLVTTLPAELTRRPPAP
jgi:6-bladed beta-propeller